MYTVSTFAQLFRRVSLSEALIAHLLRTRCAAENAALPVRKETSAAGTGAFANVKTLFLKDISRCQKESSREVIRRVVRFDRARPPHATLFWRHAEVLRNRAFYRKGQLCIPIRVEVFQGSAQRSESLDDFLWGPSFPRTTGVSETGEL
jgi:hypothetical protein